MADAVREFTGTYTQTYAGQITHMHKHLQCIQYSKMTWAEAQTHDQSRWLQKYKCVWTKDAYNLTTQSRTRMHKQKPVNELSDTNYGWKKILDFMNTHSQKRFAQVKTGRAAPCWPIKQMDGMPEEM